MQPLAWIFGGVLGLFAISGCGDDGGGSSCDPGSVGCECLAGTCMPGLVCNGAICTYPGGDGGDGMDGTGPGDDGDAGSDGGPGDGGDGTGPGDDGNTGDDGSTGGMGDPDGPVVLSFFTEKAAYGVNEQIQFTAQVTDPDGLADLVGGTLENGDGTHMYGPFTQGAPGTFTAQALASAFPVGAWPEERAFGARFFDAAAHETVATLTVPIACDIGNSYAECVACEAANCPAEFASCWGPAWPDPSTTGGECDSYRQCLLGCECASTCEGDCYDAAPQTCRSCLATANLCSSQNSCGC